jgi:hypothetical protein
MAVPTVPVVAVQADGIENQGNDNSKETELSRKKILFYLFYYK